jgi:putative flippase GtrA
VSLVDKTLARFIAVGFVNTGIGAALMFCLYNLFGWSYWAASAANYTVGSIVSFFLNKYFTFNARHWSVYMIAAFILTIAFSCFIAYSISRSVATYLLRNTPQKFRENAALFTGMCLFTGINYIGQRYFVFKKHSA